jgi:hypothetical protein
MKTTLNIDDAVMRRIKAEAARRRCTMSALVETALRGFLQKRPPRQVLPPLPTSDFGGPALVDVDDRDALYDAMEDR